MNAATLKCSSVPILLTEPPRPAAIRESPRAHWYVVGTVCIGAFMGQLDASIVTIALPRIGRELHATVGATEWVALSYLLVLIATVAAVGQLGDAIGRKLLYTYGFAIFAAGSALCGLAPSLPALIAARAAQALGAAMLQANSVALITEAMPRSRLGQALGLQGAAQALGLALGPAAGGVLVSVGGWRLIFLVNLPVGAVGIALAWLLVPRTRSRRRLRDLNPRILRRPAMSVGLGGALISFSILFGVLFAVSYYLSARHVAAAVAGLELALLPVGIAVTAPLAGRFGSERLASTGMVLTGTGALGIALAHGAIGLPAGLGLIGIGLGAFIPSNNAAIMAAAREGYTGLTGGLLNMTRATGTAVGVAAAGAFYAAGGLALTMAALGGTAVLAGAWLADRRRSDEMLAPRRVPRA